MQMVAHGLGLSARRRPERSGVGSLWVVNSAGQAVDCEGSSWGVFLDPACWAAELGGIAQGGSQTPPSGVPMAPVDCSQFWNSLFNSSCSMSRIFLPVAAIAIGAVLFLAIKR